MDLERLKVQACEHLWFLLRQEILADEAGIYWRKNGSRWKAFSAGGANIERWLNNQWVKIEEVFNQQQILKFQDISCGHLLICPLKIVSFQALILFHRQAEAFSSSELEAVKLLAGAIASFLSQFSGVEISSRFDSPDDPYLGELIIGESEVIKKLRRIINQIRSSDTPVLIVGESGTGKELVARAIHQVSPRNRSPFVVINCGAIPEHLLESELFGHVRGAFTGALRDKPGLVEEASGGTLFLDEIGDLAFPLQAKILRLIQEKEFRRVGDLKIRQSDVRFISATNRQLEEEIKLGRFREDLYYRLKIITLELPPLRERKEDLLILVNHFLKIFGPKFGKPQAFITPEALERLLDYDWPGNIRELQNEIQRALILCGPDGVIEEKDLSSKFFKSKETIAPRGENFFKARADFERRFLRTALARYNYNRTRTADSLGLSRQGLTKLLKKHALIDCKNSGTKK
ncbi:MAG: sigma 54-interacting transcriptional regulator [Candidatus Aminicenantes bacterium]|nr:sigma 54-interacting transcriptional regulator [Candidatus Aminicenantes bacterium]